LKGSYISIGDSIQIDSYPALDQGLHASSPVGCASRFGGWLSSQGYVDGQYKLAVDGACISEIRRQIRRVPKETRHLVNIITLTAGGNDLSFGAMDWKRSHRDESNYPNLIAKIKDDYKDLCREVGEVFPNSFVIVNTHYDPSDATGELPNCGAWSGIVEWYSRGRRELGNYTRSREPLPNEQFLVSDLLKLFDGHGMADPNWGSRWYYKNFMIEPGYTGAMRIARQWVYTLKRTRMFDDYVQEMLELQDAQV